MITGAGSQRSAVRNRSICRLATFLQPGQGQGLSKGLPLGPGALPVDAPQAAGAPLVQGSPLQGLRRCGGAGFVPRLKPASAFCTLLPLPTIGASLPPARGSLQDLNAAPLPARPSHLSTTSPSVKLSASWLPGVPRRPSGGAREAARTFTMLSSEGQWAIQGGAGGWAGKVHAGNHGRPDVSRNIWRAVHHSQRARWRQAGQPEACGAGVQCHRGLLGRAQQLPTSPIQSCPSLCGASLS